MPTFGMYTAEGTLISWLKSSDEFVRAGEPVLEIETEKSVLEVTAPESGVLHHIASPGTHVQVEMLLGYILAPGEQVPATITGNSNPEPVAPIGPSATTAPAQEGAVLASPIARRLAAQYGVDIALLSGTGPGGRVVEADVKAAISSARQHS